MCTRLVAADVLRRLNQLLQSYRLQQCTRHDRNVALAEGTAQGTRAESQCGRRKVLTLKAGCEHTTGVTIDSSYMHVDTSVKSRILTLPSGEHSNITC